MKKLDKDFENYMTDMSAIVIVNSFILMVMTGFMPAPYFELNHIFSTIIIVYYFFFKKLKLGNFGVYDFGSKGHYHEEFFPLIFYNFALFYNNCCSAEFISKIQILGGYVEEKNIFFCLFFSIFFFFLVYITRIFNSNFEFFRLVGINFYCLIGHYNIESFSPRVSYVAALLFLFGYVYPVLFKFFFYVISFDSGVLYKFRYGLLKVLWLILEFKKFNVIIRIAIYFILITMPIVFAKMFFIPFYGVFIVLIILSFQKLAIEYYCYIIRYPSAFLSNLDFGVSYEQKIDFVHLYSDLISAERDHDSKYYVLARNLMFSVHLYFHRVSRNNLDVRSAFVIFERETAVIEQAQSGRFCEFNTMITGIAMYSPSIFNFIVSGIV